MQIPRIGHKDFRTLGMTNRLKEQVGSFLQNLMDYIDVQQGAKERHFALFVLTNEGKSDTGDLVIATDVISSLHDHDVIEMLEDWIDKRRQADAQETQ